MQKICFLFTFVLLLAHKNYGQANTGASLSAKDSTKILQELTDLLDSADMPTSYMEANIGIGNRLFSDHNNALNAKQTAGKMIYTPSVGYFHKSGFGLTSAANLLKDVNGLDINQYSVSPYYQLSGNKNFDFSISYAHYFVKDKFSMYSSPIQNDFFTSLVFKKKWLQPGFALGYSTGEYKEAIRKDTVIINVHRRLYDSITYRLNTFSVIFTIGHSYDWYGVLNKMDGLKLTHTLMANAGSGKTTISHKTNAQYLYNLLNRKAKIPKLQTDKFGMQSIGLDMDLNYSIGNFIFEPQLYIDYYLPVTNEKRFSQILAFTIGYIFQ